VSAGPRAGGVARQAQIRAVLGEQGYRQRNVKRKAQNAKRLRQCYTWLQCKTLYALRFTFYVLEARALAIEVVGGVHALTTARDEARLAALRAQGLTVITLTNDQVYAGATECLFASLLEVRHAA
jgi:hypothetical protein